MLKACLFTIVLGAIATASHAHADCPTCRDGSSHHGSSHHGSSHAGARSRTATTGPNGNRPRTAFMYRYTEWYGIHYTQPLNYRLQLDYPWHAPVRSTHYAGHEHFIAPDGPPAAPRFEEIAPPNAGAAPYRDVEVLPAPSARAPRRTLLR
jgi:hypothetical protein